MEKGIKIGVLGAVEGLPMREREIIRVNNLTNKYNTCMSVTKQKVCV